MCCPLSPQTNLSLEQKQQLAKQQEQQQRLKSQPSLTPSATKATLAKTGGGNQPRSTTKDLTSTLIESNMNAMKSTSMGQNKPPQSSYNANSSWSSGPTWSSSNSAGMSMGLSSGGGGFNASQASGMGFGQPGPSFSMPQQATGFGTMGMSSPRMNTQQPKPDLSAFDSLLDSSQKQTPSMNQMAVGSNRMGAPRPAGFNQPHPMGMMPVNPMGSSGMGLGANAMGMGSPMMSMPAQQPGFGAGGGMFGQMGMGGVQGQNAGGHMLSPTGGSTHTAQKSSTNSLDDLLG